MTMADLLEIGEKVPGFTLQDIDGKEYRLSYNLGKGPIILDFFRGGW